ncbi:MAG: cobyrinate a,c-diamide synthase [Lachnospiraceae bacterium]
MFHRYVLGIPGSNLDSFFLDEDGVRQLFEERSADHELALIEGVMGYYDGVAGTSFQASSYEIARITDTPAILVVDAKKSSRSVSALIKGFLEYQKDSRIVGVILNRTSPMMTERLRPLIEELGVKLIGAVPECPEAQLESRHLGLTLPNEQKSFAYIWGHLRIVEQCLDIPKLLALAGIAEDQDLNDHEKKETNKKNEKNGYDYKENSCKNTNSEEEHTGASLEDLAPLSSTVSTRRIGVAQDEAFCFYYQENLEFLRQNGWEIVTFSPLHDQKIPENLDALLLGGGYPELYARELSENHSMLESIRIAGTDQTKKIKILAECGGFLYLHRTLEDPDGKKWQMVGLLDADAFRTKKLSRFGYITLKTNQTNPALLPDQMPDQMESKKSG